MEALRTLLQPNVAAKAEDDVDVAQASEQELPPEPESSLVEEEETSVSDISDVLDISVLQERRDQSSPASPAVRPRFRVGGQAPPPTPAGEVLSPPLTVIRRYLSGKQNGGKGIGARADRDDEEPEEEENEDEEADENRHYMQMRGLPRWAGKKTVFPDTSPLSLNPINWQPLTALTGN
jgi:hypothetical protein